MGWRKGFGTDCVYAVDLLLEKRHAPLGRDVFGIVVAVTRHGWCRVRPAQCAANATIGYGLYNVALVIGNAGYPRT